MDDLKDIRWKQRFENYERSFNLFTNLLTKSSI